MKALISPPRVHQPAAGTVALTYEMKLEGFIEPFEVFLIETPDGEIPPLNLADHIPDHQVILAGGERIMIFPWHIDHTNPAGHYRMEFRAAGHSFYPEPFQVVAYSWGVLSTQRTSCRVSPSWAWRIPTDTGGILAAALTT